MTDYDHIYSSGFYDFISQGATKSADIVANILTRQLTPAPKSVVDFGCGRGIWTNALSEAFSAQDVTGLDGAYVDTNALAIPPSRFTPCDLSKPIDLGRQFDLAISLEVAEHLPRASAADFIASIVTHSDLVLFSAAVPGQGGEHHVNEQPLKYWRNKFEQHGYVALDPVRPLLVDCTAVEPWYRYNILLYASPAAFERLPEHVRSTRIAPEKRIHNFSSMNWRLRCAMMQTLPHSAVDQIVDAKRFATRLIRGHTAKGEETSRANARPDQS